MGEYILGVSLPVGAFYGSFNRVLCRRVRWFAYFCCYWSFCCLPFCLCGRFWWDALLVLFVVPFSMSRFCTRVLLIFSNGTPSFAAFQYSLLFCYSFVSFVWCKQQQNIFGSIIFLFPFSFLRLDSTAFLFFTSGPVVFLATLPR